MLSYIASQSARDFLTHSVCQVVYMDGAII